MGDLPVKLGVEARTLKRKRNGAFWCIFLHIIVINRNHFLQYLVDIWRKLRCFGCTNFLREQPACNTGCRREIRDVVKDSFDQDCTGRRVTQTLTASRRQMRWTGRRTVAVAAALLPRHRAAKAPDPPRTDLPGTRVGHPTVREPTNIRPSGDQPSGDLHRTSARTGTHE